MGAKRELMNEKLERLSEWAADVCVRPVSFKTFYTLKAHLGRKFSLDFPQPQG